MLAGVLGPNIENLPVGALMLAFMEQREVLKRVIGILTEAA